MLMYALIGLSLVLTGIVGLQFTYLYWADRMFQERKTYLRSLEQRHAELAVQLEAAERRVAEQDKILGVLHTEFQTEEDAWAEVIEEI